MLDGRSRTISLCMSIDGFVRNNRYPRDYNIFQHDDGTPMTPAEARTYLALEKAKGRHVIPVSAECGNPCKHAQNGCTGFDYGERGGCPGRFTNKEAALMPEAATSAPAGDILPATWEPQPLDVIPACLDNSFKRAAQLLRSTGHEGDAMDASRIEYARAALASQPSQWPPALAWTAIDAFDYAKDAECRMVWVLRSGEHYLGRCYFGRGPLAAGSSFCMDEPDVHAWRFFDSHRRVPTHQQPTHFQTMAAALGTAAPAATPE